MKNKLHIHDWNDHQTYRHDRGQPPWIKVYRDLVRNPKWVSLTDAQRGQLVSLWILAADSCGWVQDDPAFLKKICYMDSVPDLDLFISLGFVDARRHDGVKVASNGRQPDAPEESRVEESRVEERHCPIDRMVEIVNEHRSRAGLTELRGGDKVGRRYIRTRIKEHDPTTVEAVARYAPHDRWISETHDRLSLAAIFSPKSFPMLLDRMENHGVPESGLSVSDRRLIEHRKRLEIL